MADQRIGETVRGLQPSTTQSPPPENLAKVLGRDNPAGRALHLLYAKNTGKNAGAAFNSMNKARHEKQLASGYSPTPVAAPSPPKIEKPQVNVPKFPKRVDYERHAIDFVPKRRPGELIQKEMEEEAERMRRTPMPATGRAVLDEAEKDRLATLMRYRGKPPKLSEEELSLIKKNPAKKSERQTLQDLFDSVLEEIEDRRRFLQEMEAKGALKQETLYIIKGEISSRVQELDKIDKRLKALDGVSAAP